MKAMILAAGRGERMQQLTETTPKPLLKANGKPLIEYNLEQLVDAGFKEIVINIAYLGNQIVSHLGDGSRWGIDIVYSDEGTQALETAGGIHNALPLLGNDPFLVINADIAFEFELTSLLQKKIKLAHLVLIPNPAHHPEGDFHLDNNGIACLTGKPQYTYSGIGIFHPKLFHDLQPGIKRLAPILRSVMHEARVSAELYTGFWLDIGTPERLKTLEIHYRQRSND